ncbi:MAG: hypothetical protein WEB60_04255 [Terrimicrobiaceae bacterium]
MALALTVILIAGGGFYAWQRLPQIATWAMERSLPGARVNLKDITIHFPNHVTVKEFTLHSRETGERLLSLKGGSLTFDFQKLASRKLTSIELVEPVIDLSPGFLALFAPAKPTGKAAKPDDRRWEIGRIFSNYGELNVTGIGPKNLKITSKFAFDLTGLFSADGQEQILTFWDVVTASKDGPPVLALHLVTAVVNPAKIKSGKITSLTLDGGSLNVGKRLLSFFEGNDRGGSPTSNLVFEKIAINRLSVNLEDDRNIVSDIQFAVNTTLANLPLSQAASTLGEEIQHIEIADLEILSPHDPLAKVLTIRSLAFEFTLAGLLRREIRAIHVSGPSIHVSPDLFWYMEDAQKRFDTTGGDSPSGQPGWTVSQFTLTGGSLILGSGGRSTYGLPLTFRTSAQNVALDNLASLRAQAVLEIPSQKYSFEQYQLEFTSQAGELRLAYPPDQNNLVGTVQLDTIRWRQYRAAEAWLSVTFDQSGINGSFGGTTYKGYSSGGFSFFFNTEAPWIGWVSGKGLDLRQLTDVISPQNFQMTGPLDFQLQVDAKRALIQRVKGHLQTTKPGRLKISKLDDMLARIPDTWPGLKKDSTRIAIETLRDFDFDKCVGDFWFVDSQGIFDLALQGPAGSRNFEIVLHSENSSAGQWKKQKPNSP